MHMSTLAYTGDEDMGGDESDVDPRTLAQAAARLAKYTSEGVVGALPEQQWADLYNEVHDLKSISIH
jgi:hypothetical protein